MADPRLSAAINPERQLSLADWLSAHFGEDSHENGRVAILDLSLVPSDTVHTVIAVFARVVFEALQRYRKQHREGKTLPTVLVLEEAHTFVRRSSDEDGIVVSPFF